MVGTREEKNKQMKRTESLTDEPMQQKKHTQVLLVLVLALLLLLRSVC